MRALLTCFEGARLLNQKYQTKVMAGRCLTRKYRVEAVFSLTENIRP
jgi:hypothetical protein